MTLPVPGPDRTALVTGASSGIGVELARLLAARGHGVTLVARREDRLRALADELAASAGVRTEVIAADLTDAGSREGVVRQLDERALEVDILVNNAGFSTMGPVQGSDPDREVAMVRTDVEAVVHLCSLVIPGMVDRGRGAVLNVASTAAFQPIPGQAGYAASKAFVLSYSRAIGQELRGTGVTVTTLCPGPVETGFAEAAGIGDDQAGEALPKIMWVSAPDVARAAVDALDKGRPVVIPGGANRALAQLSHHTPRRLLLPLLARQHPALRD
ncbi:MAG: ydfG 2 [Acidimicrobiales bacterium]|nr:ydfG 2 [Acidimicrobiales bacterium]